MGESTSVRVNKDTKRELDLLGGKTDTHEKIISRLIYFYKTRKDDKGK